jgi:hypothetical protein
MFGQDRCPRMRPGAMGGDASTVPPWYVKAIVQSLCANAFPEDVRLLRTFMPPVATLTHPEMTRVPPVGPLRPACNVASKPARAAVDSRVRKPTSRRANRKLRHRHGKRAQVVPALVEFGSKCCQDERIGGHRRTTIRCRVTRGGVWRHRTGGSAIACSRRVGTPSGWGEWSRILAPHGRRAGIQRTGICVQQARRALVRVPRSSVARVARGLAVASGHADRNRERSTDEHTSTGANWPVGHLHSPILQSTNLDTSLTYEAW